ncbi:MAG: TonB-dependent receptor [Pseudomonadota bacterium]
MKRTLFYSSICLALASPTSLANEKLEEIVVRGELRETPLLEASSSISVLGDAIISERGAQQLEEILKVAPNVNFAGGTSRARYFQIRGVGDRSQFENPLNPSVGLLVDRIDFSGIGSIGTLFDVEQVEILRGPQGTLHGANALAGLINVTSNAPSAEPYYHLEGTAGDYGTYGLGAVASGPITEKLLYRLAIQQFNSDGYQDNSFLNSDDTADRDELTSRARLRWLPSEAHQFDLGVTYIDMDNGYDAFSLDNNRTTRSDEPGKDTQESLGVTVHSYSEFQRFDLQTAFAYADSDILYSFDLDWTFDGFHPDGYTGFDEYKRKRKSASSEIRLLSNEESRLFNDRSDWVFGFYFLRNDEDLDRTYTFAPFFSAENDTKTYALFGQLDTRLTDRLTLVTGLRWEDRQTDYSDNNAVSFDPDDDMWGGRIALEYDIAENTMVYGAVSRGYRALGVNGAILANLRTSDDPDVINDLQAITTFDEETLINYEIGFKSLALDGRLTARVAIFYMDREDQQVSGSVVIPLEEGVTDFIGYTSNAAEGENYGAEIEVDWLATDALQLWGNLGLLKTEFDEYVNEFGEDLSGREQAYAPAYQYSVGARYNFPLDTFVRLELEGMDDFYLSDDHNEQTDGYDVVNAAVGIEREAWSLILWGRNLADKDYIVRGFGNFGNDPRNGYVTEPYYQFGEPRVYGITGTLTF